MVRVIVVIREVGRIAPDYSLDFDLPEIPRIGDYISIQRPDHRAPFGEDLIVRQVWWRLDHPETRGITPSDQTTKVGKMREIFVECDAAIGPYSSDNWRRSLEVHVERGEVEELKVARVSFPESILNKD